MFSKVVIFLAVVAFASAGYLQPAPAFHAAPLSFAAPAISRVEHLPPAVASSYKTEVFTPPAARTYQIAPAVTHFAPAPVVPVAPAPAPLVYPVPAAPRIAHYAPGAFAAPAVHAAPLVRAAPINFGFGGHGFAAGYGHGLGYASGYGHGLGYASGFGHGLGYSKYF
ncbi:hypothetical protein FQR65_LT00507 [Abscondita terminalis]|nr:hypothetical protein FQR65_LT00507 [Abscondita terminalis]